MKRVDGVQSDHYTMLVALHRMDGEWKPGQHFRWMSMVNQIGKVIAFACDPGHPDWVGVVLEIQAFKDPDTGLPCALAKIDRSREKNIAIDTETWWLDPGVGSPMFPKKETASERGTRIHQELAREMQARPVLQLHDELIFETATNGRPAYRCMNLGCPERVPVYADRAPKCYTCDRPMQVTQPTEYDLKTVAKQIESARKRVTELMRGKAPLFIPTRVEPDYGVPWFADKVKAPSSTRKHLRAKDPCVTAVDIARGSDLDVLGEVAGLVRTPPCTTMTAEGLKHPETDAEFRDRILAKLPKFIPMERQIELALGSHVDVASVNVKRSFTLPESYYIEVTLHPDKMRHALHDEFRAILDKFIPVTVDWRLDLVYSQR